MLTPRGRKHGTRDRTVGRVTRLTGCWAAATACYDALLHIGLEDAEGLFVSLDGHVERLQHALGSEVIHHDPLLDVDRLSRDAEWLRVQAEVENQFFGRAGDTAEICVERNRVFVGYFDTLRLLHWLRSSLRLVAIITCLILIGHDISP
jgi:hypothetical protein